MTDRKDWGMDLQSPEALRRLQLILVNGDFALEFPRPLLPLVKHVRCFCLVWLVWGLELLRFSRGCAGKDVTCRSI